MAVLPAVKLIGSGVAATGLVASGAGIASLIKVSEKTEYVKEMEEVTPQQEQFENAESRYTVLKFYRKKNLYFEQSFIDEQDYIRDHIHGGEIANYISYIVNKDGNNIRISLKKPEKEPSGIYVGRKLNKFFWKDKEKGEWYGYCPPKDWPTGGEECDKLPDGWEREEL